MTFCCGCKRILVAEDERTLRVPLTGFLKAGGGRVVAVEDGTQALAALEREPFDIVVTDIQMPGADGLAVLQRARALHPQCHVVLITAFASLETAVAALRLGAADYLVKPFKFQELADKLGPLCTRHAPDDTATEDSFHIKDFVACSMPMQAVLTTVRQVAPGEASVLVLGETGVGKELVAGAIHHMSRRVAGPMVRVNCAAIPDTLFESEFFGHEKGAFTGAVGRRTGRLEAADGGTLFLDEVGSLSAEGQAKLLRALQTHEFERVGSSKPVRSDFRVIAAAQEDLLKKLEVGTFRADLYYRLAVFTIRVPALRERVADIEPLAMQLVAQAASRAGKPVPRLSQEALALLQARRYPGNVRELQNVVERAVTLCNGEDLLAAHVGDHSFLPAPAKPDAQELVPLGEATARFERVYIERALTGLEGNRSKTAEVLGISRKTLWEKMRRKEDEQG